MAGLLWQSMKLEYFIPLINDSNPQLVLQHLKRYEEFKESRQYRETINKLLEAKNSKNFPIEDIHKIRDFLIKSYEAIDRLTYLSCFYNEEKPSANMLRYFGGESGVSVGFDKDLIREAVKERSKELGEEEPANIWREYPVDYTAGKKEEFEERVEKIFEYVISNDADEISSNESNIKLRDLVVNALFRKSHYYEDEKEYRIVHGADVTLASTQAIMKLEIPRKAIKQIAIHSSNLSAMRELIQILGCNNLNYSIDERKETNAYYTHPLALYDVKEKN